MNSALAKATKIKSSIVSMISITLIFSTFLLYGLGQATIFRSFLGSAVSYSGAGWANLNLKKFFILKMEMNPTKD